MIITKSVSRFARNLLDYISWVWKLKERDPPIQVFFEQEHMNTLDTTSNIILFVLAMVAEEESHMKSEVVLLSLEWRFSRGRFLTPTLLGYDKVEIPDGHCGHKKVLQINEEEAVQDSKNTDAQKELVKDNNDSNNKELNKTVQDNGLKDGSKIFIQFK